MQVYKSMGERLVSGSVEQIAERLISRASFHRSNQMKSIIIKVLASAWLLMVSAFTQSATEWQSGIVTELLADTQFYGGCMIKSPDFQPSVNCRSEWVSLDCNGEYNSKVDARRMWETAQMAVALGSKVNVVINDAKKHNDFCVVDTVGLVN